MSEKDLEYVVKLEKAIKQKYGAEAVQNPKANWTDVKEKQYLEQLKRVTKENQRRTERNEKVETNGFLVSKQLVTPRDKCRICPVCNIYSFELKDDVYMNKFECCFECYIRWVENREKRWNSGWRPNKEE